jgi:hypothetical protein
MEYREEGGGGIAKNQKWNSGQGYYLRVLLKYVQRSSRFIKEGWTGTSHTARAIHDTEQVNF